MRRVTMAGLCLLATLVTGGLSVATASADSVHYAECVQVEAKTGAYTTKSCTKTSAKHTGSYELRFATKRQPLTAKATHVTLESSIATVTCKKAGITGFVNASDGGWGPVVFRFTGCTMGGLPCASAGAANSEEIAGPEIAGRIGDLAGEGTEDPTVGLGFVAVGSTALPTLEFTCGTVEARVHGAFFGVVGGNFNHARTTSTLTFTQSGGIQEFPRFESGLELGGPQRIELRTSPGGEFEPQPGALAGFSATFKVKTAPLETTES